MTKQKMNQNGSDFDEQASGSDAEPLVPGTKDSAILAQRHLRGILYIFFFLLVALNIFLGVLVRSAVNGRSIQYVPTVRAASELIGGREATDTEIKNLATQMLILSETFTSASVSSTQEKITPYLDPGIVSFFEAYYDKAQSTMRGQPTSRSVMPLTPLIFNRNTSDLTVVVPYERIILRRQGGPAELRDSNRGLQVQSASRRVAVMRWRKREASVDNTYGLYLARIDHFSRREWLEAGRRDIWTER